MITEKKAQKTGVVISPFSGEITLCNGGISNTYLTLFLTNFRIFEKIAIWLPLNVFSVDSSQTRINTGFSPIIGGVVLTCV
jgi:hypothetical protein